MLKNIATKLINKFLKEHIVIGEDKNVLVQSWSGNVNLKKIELVQKYYHNFSLRGMIEDLSLVIPWKNLINGYVTIEASNVDIFIESYDVQQGLSKLKVNGNEQAGGDDKKEKKRTNFLLRKLLEKLLVRIENLNIYYRKYRLRMNLLSVNDKKEISIEGVSLEMNSEETYIRKIMPFDFKGKISNNSINAYVDCVDILVRRKDIVEIACDMIDLYKDVVQVSKESNERPGVEPSKQEMVVKEKDPTGDNEDKIVQELKGNTKRIINLDEEIKVCLVLDKLKFKIIKGTKKGLIKVLKYRIVDLKLEHCGSTRLDLRLKSSTLNFVLGMKNDVITVSDVHVDTVKIIRRLGYRLRKKQDLVFVCREIEMAEHRLSLQDLRMKDKDVCLEVPLLSVYNTVELIYIKMAELKITGDVCRLLMFVKTHIELIDGNKFIKKITNRLSTTSDTKLPWIFFCLNDCNLNAFLLTKNLQILPDCTNAEEIERMVTAGKQPVVEDAQGYVVKSESIRWYDQESKDVHVRLFDSAISIARIHFGDFIIEGIERGVKNYHIRRLEYDKVRLDNLNINYEDVIKVEIDELVAYNDYWMIKSVYGIKNVIYSLITDQIVRPEKRAGKDVEISIRTVLYHHKGVFKVEDLLFKDDRLVLKVTCYDLAVSVAVCILDDRVKINVKAEGSVDPTQYNNILYSVIEFVDILITVLDNAYEGKTKSKDVVICSDVKLMLRGVVCARMSHCDEDCYMLSTSVTAVISGVDISVEAPRGVLTRVRGNVIEDLLSNTIRGEKDVIEDSPSKVVGDEKGVIEDSPSNTIRGEKDVIVDSPYNTIRGENDATIIDSFSNTIRSEKNVIAEKMVLPEQGIVIEDLKVKIRKIENGLNLKVNISDVLNSVLLHKILILKEYYVLPQLGIIGTAMRLNYAIYIARIRNDLPYDLPIKTNITNLCVENDTMKLDAEYENICTRLNIKTTYDVVNTLKVSTNNIVIKSEVQDFISYQKIVQTLLDEFNTNFTSGRNTQINLIVKDSELYVNRSRPQNTGTNHFVETIPLLMVSIEKLIFFSPTTGSLKFAGYVFNPRILEYELLFEPANVVVAMLGNKISVKCTDLRLSIAKETFQTFSFDHKDCIVQLENIMSSLNVLLRAGQHEKYALDAVPEYDEHDLPAQDAVTRARVIRNAEESENKGCTDESTGLRLTKRKEMIKRSFNRDGIPDPKVSDVIVGPLTGAIVHKRFYSKKLDLMIGDEKITVDLTEEEKLHVHNAFVFTKIHEFNRYIRVYNHIYFKNCLPYELCLLLGDDELQEEELLLKKDLSFNSPHMYLRIKMGKKISADSFMFQKGVYRADVDNVTLFLDEKSILIEKKIINMLSYVENVSGHLVYYVFFLPNSYIVNKTSRSLNICLEGSFFARNIVMEPEEIVAADCWRFKERIGIKGPSDEFVSVSNAFLNRNQSTQVQVSDERTRHDFIISHKSLAEHSSILLTRKKLSVRILRNVFKVFNLYVLNFRFKVTNSINEKVYIDDERVMQGTTERDITRGTVLINNRLRIFDFNVLNVLKELEHKYLLSMETKNVVIDVGTKLDVIDQDNVADPHEIQFDQKYVEIKYSYVVENRTGIELTVNDTFFGNDEHKPIEMHKKNMLRINGTDVNMIVCPYFQIGDNFYTVITKIREKQKIMRLETSESPIEIHNNTETVVCVNKKYFLNPGDTLNYVYGSYKDTKIEFETNIEGKLVRLRRKYGRAVCTDNFKVTSMNRGAKEYIYLGTTPTNVHFEDVFVVLINSLTVSLFENNREFVNLYFRDLEAVKQIDTLKNLFTYAFSIKGMQIDNQSHSPAFPIILSPVYPTFYYHNSAASANDGHFLIYKCEINGAFFNQDESVPAKGTLSFNYIIFAMHEFELSIEEEVLTRLFMWMPKKKGDTSLFCTLLHIHPINLRLNLLISKKKHFIHKLIGFLVSNLSEVRLSFTTLIFSQFEYNNDLIINAYKMQMLSQIFNLIGGLDLLGNLSSLVEELSLGVHDLFYEPYVGLKHDDLFMFTKGILKGGKNFVTYCISGLTSTVGKMGRSISRTSSNKRLLFYDELEVDVTKDLIENVVDGLSGIITKPVKGAKKGVKGFLKGVGSGLKGALMKPIAGISEFAANISDNIKTNMNGADLRRIQYPRYKLEKYNLDLCQAYFLFEIYKDKDMQPIDSNSQGHFKAENEKFVGGGRGKVYDMKVHMVVTDQRLLMISRQANLHINCFDVVTGGIKVKDWIVELNDEVMNYVKTIK